MWWEVSVSAKKNIVAEAEVAEAEADWGWDGENPYHVLVDPEWITNL